MHKLYRKPTDRQAYLHNSSYHPNSTKRGIPYSQALRIKRICTETKELENNLENLKTTLISRGYDQNYIEKEFVKARKITREAALIYKEKNKGSIKSPFITTYNKHNPKIQEIINNNWNLLNLDQETSQKFVEKPIVVYRRNKNLRDIIGQTTIINNKVQREKQRPTGGCKPCKPDASNLCCKQLSKANTITSTVNNKTFKIYHTTNCKSTNIIYVMECIKCRIQYVGKSEPPFEIRINGHRSDATNPTLGKKIIPASKHFHDQHHNFNRDAKFTIVEQIQDQRKTKEEKRQLLLKRENIWITNLGTLNPRGFNIKLNKV